MKINPAVYIIVSFFVSLALLVGLVSLVSAQAAFPSLPSGYAYVPFSATYSLSSNSANTVSCSSSSADAFSCTGSKVSWAIVNVLNANYPPNAVGIAAVVSGSGDYYPSLWFGGIGLSFTGLNQSSIGYQSDHLALALADNNLDGGSSYPPPAGGSIQLDGFGSATFTVQIAWIVSSAPAPTPTPAPTATPAPENPSKSPFGLDLTCTHFYTVTGTTITYSGDLIDNPGFEAGGSVPSLWSFFNSFFGFTSVADSLLSNEGAYSLVYDLNQSGTNPTSFGQSVTVSNLRDTYVLDFAYRLGQCPFGLGCENGRSLSASVDGNYVSFPTSYENNDSCTLVGSSLSGQYYNCDWQRASITYTLSVSVPQPKTFALSLGAGSNSFWVDDIHLYPVNGQGVFECIPPDDLFPPTPTPPPLPTAPPLPTIGAVPTVDTGIEIVPGEVSCLGWSEFSVISQTVPSLQLCMEPQIVTVAPSHPLNSLIGGGLGSYLTIGFSGAIAIALISFIRRR